MIPLKITVLAVLCYVAFAEKQYKCYKCEATNGKNCETGECTGEICMKDVYITVIDGKQTNSTVRKHCEHHGLEGCFPGQLVTPSPGQKKYLCGCTGDFCNRVEKNKPHQVLLSVFILALPLVFRMI